MNSARRGGFSLLEVLMATSILLGSIIVLNQLAGIGRRNAVAAEDLSTAQLLCQTKLNEILAGASPLDPVDGEPITGADGWVYSLDLQPVESPAAQIGRVRLTRLNLTVSRETPQRERGARFTLVRWVTDTGREIPGPGLARDISGGFDRRAIGGL